MMICCVVQMREIEDIYNDMLCSGEMERKKDINKDIHYIIIDK